MRTILVTGANGFIGSSVYKSFKNRGFEVIGWVRNVKLHEDKFMRQVDMSSYNQVVEKLRLDKPDMIIHCAGSADVNKSVLYPNEDYINNVSTTHNLLFALHCLGLDSTKVVFLSSAAVYGNPNCLPINESLDLKPLSPYALHKVMAEQVCIYFIKNYNFDIKILRIFSAYGVGLKKQIFWDMYRKIEETGKLVMLGNGQESRDYINIQDVIEAIYLVMTNTQKNEIIYNVANGSEIKIKTVVELFAKCYRIDLNLVFFSRTAREGDPKNWKADISKLCKLGYKPKVDISTGIEEYVDWIKSL